MGTEFFKKKCHELGIHDQVTFTGFRRDVLRLYAAMDIFILGTDAEPCGRVIFEAMSMQKPVVATNSGGTPEIVINGETGFLFDYNNSEELAVKLEYLLRNPKLAKSMGDKGRRRIEENFTIDKYVAKIQHEYIKLINNEV